MRLIGRIFDVICHHQQLTRITQIIMNYTDCLHENWGQVIIFMQLLFQPVDPPRLNFIQRHSSCCCCCWRCCGSGWRCLSPLFAVYFDCLGCGGCQLIQLRDARNLSQHRMSPSCRSLHFTGPQRMSPCLSKLKGKKKSINIPHTCKLFQFNQHVLPPEGESFIRNVWGQKRERRAEPLLARDYANPI